jgi:hypothetical protein
MKFERSFKNKNKCLFNAYDLLDFLDYCERNNGLIPNFESVTEWYAQRKVKVVPEVEFSTQYWIDKLRNEIGEIDRNFVHRKRSFEWVILRKRKLKKLRGYLWDKYYIPITEDEINFDE